jgi:outer membrane protein OmpA-like peptidoglycan-associated protein
MKGAYAGDGAVRALPQLVFGGVTPWFVWSAAAGPELRAAVMSGGVMHGPSFRWSAGMGFLPGDGKFQIGPEAHGAVALVATSKDNLDADIFAGARYRFGRSFVTGFGAGVGLTHGPGTGDFRAVLSFAYTPDEPAERAVADRDGDRIPDALDACPDEPGPESLSPSANGCPVVADRDGDKIPDAVDACPDVPGLADVVPKLNGCPPDRDNDEIPDALDACPDEIGVPDPDPKRNGCPPVADRDGDKIPDAVDACPDVAGQPNANPKLNGCPGDRDGDGIYDDKDACPEEKGPPDPDPAKNGCPKDVRVTEGQIVILQQVEFDTGKATIRAVSNGLLDAVANVLKEHAEILRVEVGGHTDNRGPNEANTALSQARAEAVVTALAKRGVDRGRLRAKGYGPTRPIMSNITTLGRQKNRRVEFQILERRGKDPKDTVNEPYRK